MKENLYEVSDGDNTYFIPYNKIEDFHLNSVNPYEEGTDEWFNWCDNFDYLWGEYKI